MMLGVGLGASAPASRMPTATAASMRRRPGAAGSAARLTSCGPHVHACGAVASEEAVGFARDQARHMLRIGLELRATARRMQVPLIPIATDRHALAMAELAKGGGEGSEKAALGRLGVCGAAVLEDGWLLGL